MQIAFGRVRRKTSKSTSNVRAEYAFGILPNSLRLP